MPWNLTEEEQDAIMDAVNEVLNCWLVKREQKIEVTDENGSKQSTPIYMDQISDNAPDQIVLLNEIFMDIISTGFVIGPGPDDWDEASGDYHGEAN